MSLPVTIPFTFGNATTAQSLSSLDNNFTTIVNAVNGLTNGASQINVASITATGTANATTYLRGDGAWATISGGGSGTVTSVNANSTIGFTFTGGPVTSSGTLTLSGPTPGTSGNVLTSDGTAWISLASTGGSGNFQNQLFTSSGTWTAPSGVTKVRVTVIGGGGGSFFNGSTNAYGGQGGVAVGLYTVTPGTAYTVTVGTGGVGVTTGTGGAGGTSSFGALVSATGGTGGATSLNGTGGAGTGGTITNSTSAGANLVYSYAPTIPYFRNFGGSASSFTFASSNSGAPAARVWSVNYELASNGAGYGGSNQAANGGVGGVVYVEWVG